MAQPTKGQLCPCLSGSNQYLRASVDGVDEPMGRFRYFDLNPRSRSAEFGYTVNPQFRQQGIGTKMLF